MDRNFLLTYTHTKGYLTYGWFESIEEMNDFISSSSSTIKEINESYDLGNVRELTFDTVTEEFTVI